MLPCDGPEADQPSKVPRWFAARLRQRLILVIIGLFSIFHGAQLNSIPIVAEHSNGFLTLRLFNQKWTTSVEATPLIIVLRSQNRYSTPSALIESDGFPWDGINSLQRLFTKSASEFPISLDPGQRKTFLYVNPFLGTLDVRGLKHTVNLKITVTDASVELWVKGERASRHPVNVPWFKLILATLLIFFGAGLVVRCCLPRRFSSEDCKAPETGPRVQSLILAAVFLTGFSATWLIGSRVFHFMPGFGDEANYLMQSAIFASGRLSVPAPEQQEFFRVSWMHMFGTDGKVWGFHPPGNALLLTFGLLIGVPWATIPLVGGALFVVQFLLARALFRSTTCGLVHVAVFGSSHYVLSLAGVYMAHAPSMLFISLFFLEMVRLHDGARSGALIRAAVWLGIAFLIRPLSAVLAGLVPFLWIVTRASWTRANILSAVRASTVFCIIASLCMIYTWVNAGEFAFPYSIKGLEAGKSLSSRFLQDLHTHGMNLFRNWNEFIHRVHGLGFVGNTLFFFLSLGLLRHPRETRLIILGYASFVAYLVLHSMLHWYGWKWEPRMIYDVSFVFFLISSWGVYTVGAMLSGNAIARSLYIVLVTALLVKVVVDLPGRFRTEYLNYNFAPHETRDRWRAGDLQNSIVFFSTETRFAPYAPLNGAFFDTDPLFAISQGRFRDYKLISRYPGRRVFYTEDGTVLTGAPNFFSKNASSLALAMNPFRRDQVVTVIPWLRHVDPVLLNSLPPRQFDLSEFFSWLAHEDPTRSTPVLLVLVDEATSIIKLMEQVYETERVTLAGMDETVSALWLRKRKSGDEGSVPGIQMRCRKGTTFEGPITFSSVTGTVAVDQCLGENISIEWEAAFDLDQPRQMTFELASDDGAGLFIDGTPVIDRSRQGGVLAPARAGVYLPPGAHTLKILYFNGPGPGYVKLKVLEAGEGEKEFSILSLPGVRYLYVPGLRFGRRDDNL